MKAVWKVGANEKNLPKPCAECVRAISLLPMICAGLVMVFTI